MTAKDLMIGDWVHSLEEDVYTQITDIETDGDDSVWLSDIEVFGRQFMYEIDPISLTESILQKNFPTPDKGITWCPMEYNPDSNQPCRFFHIEIARGGMELRIPSVRYVHELQHILKIARIDIEIKL